MSTWLRRFGPPDPRRFQGSGRSWLPLRLSIYALVVVGLVLWRVHPALRDRGPHPTFQKVDTTLELSGTSLAPPLIERLLAEYRSEYPKAEVVLRPGGTTQALQDLVNREADVAFLVRPPLEEESKVIRSQGDSVETFPVALGGIVLWVAPSSPIESLSAAEVHAIFRGDSSVVKRIYSPEPNRGLWDAVAERLELAPSEMREGFWQADEAAVVAAVEHDWECLGIGSTLALPDSADLGGVREVKLRAAQGDTVFTANPQSLASGDYPLFHHFYVSCRPGSSALASGFVTYVYGGRGQRLVNRLGFLPARNVPRLIQLASKPLGAKGS